MLWIATNKDGKVYLYNIKPRRNNNINEWYIGGKYINKYIKMYMGTNKELNLSWEDDPVLVSIAIPNKYIKQQGE